MFYVCCPCKGDYLQFVFRNIDPKNQDSAYIVVMGIKEDGCYQSRLKTETMILHEEIRPLQNIMESLLIVTRPINWNKKKENP